MNHLIYKGLCHWNVIWFSASSPHISILAVEMTAVMIVGVWLLFNQHCCAAGDLRNPLMEPLIRRSALEKNFMRFGRSEKSDDEHRGSDLFQLNPGDEVESSVPMSLRLKSRLSPDYDFNKGTSTGKFYRILKKIQHRENEGMNPGRLMRNNQIIDEFEREARGSENFLRFGRGGDNFMRFGREKDNNFMRFGRGSDPELRYPRSVNVGREARDKNLVRLVRQRQADKGDGFIRFGRQIGRSIRLNKRSPMNDDNRDQLPDNSRISRDCVPFFPDSNMLVAPELLLLPEISHKPPLNSNFMRLG